MIYNWYLSLITHYTENVDFAFSNDKPRTYENLNWLTGVKPTLVEFNELSISDTNASAIEEVRKQRNVLLRETDWRFRSDLTPSQGWKDYCQALRDITNNSSNWSINANGDVAINWPQKPE